MVSHTLAWQIVARNQTGPNFEKFNQEMAGRVNIFKSQMHTIQYNSIGHVDLNNIN
jgi:hypothetical protein